MGSVEKPSSLIDTYEQAKTECLLPIGLAKGARLLQSVNKDSPITCSDVEIKKNTVLELRELQDLWFAGKIGEVELLSRVDALANETLIT